MTQVQNPSASVFFDYNGLNRVIRALSTINGYTYSVQYGTDALGNKTKLIYPDTDYVNYEFDELNRLKAVKNASNNSIAEYTYDVLSRRTRKNNLNTTSAGYDYDTLNRLIGLQNPGETLTYTYDKTGNRRTKTDRFGTHNYNYDDIYQLTKVDYPDAASYPDTIFDYYKVGNRYMVIAQSSTFYETNSLNQYTNINGTDLTYDGNGNLTSDPVTPESGTNTYVYDDENRLITATTGSNIIEYAYDGFGRRVAKKIYNSLYSLLSTRYFIYDNDQIIAEYDASGTLLHKYVYGTGIDEPISLTTYDPTPNTYYYHSDGLGSIIGLTDASGSLVESYEYDAYGKTIIRGPSNELRAASSYGNRYGFTGRELDSETGLYYYRARYYSPQLGRFLQTDPIGYSDSMNLYQYCLNSPNNTVDPWGLQTTFVPLPNRLPPTAEWLFKQWLEKHQARESEGSEEYKGKRKAIIGEDMARILAYMAAHPNEKFDAFFWDDIWPFKYLPPPVLLEFNKLWIEHMMKQGREIIDLDESQTKREKNIPVSIYYDMERTTTANYPKRKPVPWPG